MSFSKFTVRRAARAAIVAVVLAPILAACDDGPTQAQTPQAPPPVTVSTPIAEDIVEWDEYTGRFQAVETVEIRSRVSGYLESVHFDDGDIVEKDALLFVIDQRPFKVALDRARAELKQARTQLKLAAKELERARPLLARGNLSQSVFDERLQARDAAQASVDAAAAAVNAARVDLDYTEIRSPVAGRAGRHLVSVGNLVSGGSETATPLTTIVSLDPIHFYFDANEKAYLKYVRLDRSGDRPGSRDTPNPVLLALADETDYPHQGQMDFVDNRFDAGTGTVRGRAVFQNLSLIHI